MSSDQSPVTSGEGEVISGTTPHSTLHTPHSVILRFLEIKESAVLVVFAVLVISLASRDITFLQGSELLTLARQYTELTIIAVGLTLVIATGGIDISVGSIVGVTSIVLGVLAVEMKMAPLAATAAALGTGALFGAINGLAVCKIRLQPVVVTLATYSGARGLAYVLSQGRPIWFTGNYGILSSPAWDYTLPLAFTLLAVAGGWFTLARTRYGRSLLATGANEKAARLSGIAVGRVKLIAYTFTGLLSGLAGVMTTIRVNTSVPDAGMGYEFEAITAVVMGGTSLKGGEASVVGTLLGVATMAVLRRGLNLAGATEIKKMFFLGLVLIVAVVLDNLRKSLVSRLRKGETKI